METKQGIFVMKFIFLTTALISLGYSASNWNPAVAYNGGDQVVFNGSTYKATFWSQGSQPDQNFGAPGSGKPWVLMSSTSVASTSQPPSPAPNTSAQPPLPAQANVQNSLLPPLVTKGLQDWPATVFAPYVDITLNNSAQAISNAINAGVKFFVIAFVSGGNGCTPMLGTTPFSSGANNGWFQALQNIRNAGGDFVVSFGGANAWGTFGSATGDMCQACTTPESLAQGYQNIINQLGLTRIDFDIEGLGVDPSNAPAIQNHIAAMKIVQNNNPSLKVWYTLPVMPDGLDDNGKRVIKSIIQGGVVVDKVNIMAMDYGPSYTDMLSTAQSAAKALEIFLAQLYPQKTTKDVWGMIGIVPMIGQNDVQNEIFTLENAQGLASFAKSNNIGVLSMWSATRDYPGPYSAVGSGLTNQNPMDFCKTFLQAQTNQDLNKTVLSASNQNTTPQTQAFTPIASPSFVQNPQPPVSQNIIAQQPLSQPLTSTQTPSSSMPNLDSICSQNLSVKQKISSLISTQPDLVAQISSLISQNQTVPQQTNQSQQKPVVVTYSGSWLSQWTSDPSKVFAKFLNQGVTHLVLSFAQPDLRYTQGSFAGTGLNYSSDFAVIQKAIAQVRSQGIKVLLAVGGATYGNWGMIAGESALSLDQAPYTQSLINLGNDLGVDGFDLDYEVDANIAQYYNALKSLRRATDALNGAKILSLPGWSVGGSCSSASQCTNGKISTFGSFIGRERALFSKIAQNKGPNVDLVTIMSYDGSNQFDPIVAFEDYNSFVPQNIPLAIGLEVPPEGWGNMTLTLNNADATCSSAVIAQDQYGTPSNQPYSVERLVGYVKKASRPSGIMLWTLDKPLSQACNTSVSGQTILQKAISILNN